MKATTIAVLGIGLLLAGCGSSERVRDIYEGERAEQQVEGGELQQGDVYTAAHVIHENELNAVAAVKGRLDDPQLVAFADELERHHRQGLQELEQAGQSIEGLTAYEGPVTRDLRRSGEDISDGLEEARGDSVDREFVDAMVRGHREALNVIDGQLIKSAQGELLPVISDLRAVIVRHLEQAERLQRSVSK